MLIAIFFLITISIVTITLSAGYYLLEKKPFINKYLWMFVEFWTIIILPSIFLVFMDLWETNDCCSDSAVFSPKHRIGIYTIIILYTLAYVISMFKKKIMPPVQELVINLLLIIGLLLNLLLCYHLTSGKNNNYLWLLGNIPIIILLLIQLAKNQNQLKNYLNDRQFGTSGKIGRICITILTMKPLYKFPILLLLSGPFLIFISMIMLLFGQQPDSLIRSFTDTYKHGFSQLDHLCYNVQCGDHFLCSVGANGHKSIVKPIRYGERNGHKIVCNRQLLVSNAFEELLQEKMPKTHRKIRQNYNKVGNLIHSYYSIFNVKFVSDIVYVLMKPLEWIFVLCLYLFDAKPENRIAMQYLKKEDRLVWEKWTSKKVIINRFND